MNDNDKNGRPETLADIVAEMRTILSVVPEGSGDVHIPKHWLEEWADCIEAALKQKRDAAPGDAAAMREALVRCATLGEFCFQNIHTEVAKIARAALAAPARNCDRFASAIDAQADWQGDEGWKARMNGETLLNWLFAPAEGGAE